jgi:aspartate dehydrogenase
VVSVGALLDDALRSKLSNGDGRLFVTTGAIGGVDLLRAASMMGELEDVSLVTRKPARAVVRPWMASEVVDALENGTEPVVVFTGPARTAVERFPESVNVAATLSLVTIGFDRVRVEVVGDPDADHVEHTVRARGAAGSYDFTIRNVPSPDNIRTSAITPFAVLRGLTDLAAHVVPGF